MSTKKFLDTGSPLITVIDILKTNKNIKITNLDSLYSDKIAKGSCARIHSVHGDTYTVWISDSDTFRTIIVEVKQLFMSTFFQQHSHGFFGHFA